MGKVHDNPTKPKIIESATNSEKSLPTKILEDSILVGLVDAFKTCNVMPQKNAIGRTEYLIEGDLDRVLSRIYANEPVGALDVLKSIKWARQAIFNYRNMKEQGKEYESRSISRHR